MNDDKVHLAVNLADLSGLGTLGSFGSPLNLMLREDMGDELLPGAWQPTGGVLDGAVVLVRTTQERADALMGGLEVVGKRKLGRKLRCSIRKAIPSKGWRYVG